jgi:hypothetical protein
MLSLGDGLEASEFFLKALRTDGDIRALEFQQQQ